jgi:hypothetical protein
LNICSSNSIYQLERTTIIRELQNNATPLISSEKLNTQ